MDIGSLSSKYFETSLGRLHYLEHAPGGGPAILFIHGFAGSVKSWTRLVRLMPEGFGIYLLDLLGHGNSDAPDADYSFKMHYDSVREFIEGIGLSRYYVFGHSYGGWIAAYHAMEARIEGLVLEDSAGLEEFMEERAMQNPHYREEMVDRALQINPRKNVLSRMINADNGDYFLTPAGLGEIESRTLVIWGEMDTTVNPKYSGVFARSIPKARLEVVPGARHTPHYTDPKAVAELLLGFMHI